VTGEVPNAPQLSQNEIDLLRAQLMACWNPPAGLAGSKDLILVMRFSLNRDGSLSGEPKIVNPGTTALFKIAAESAIKDVWRCQPFRLPAAKYEAWREVEIRLDPNDRIRRTPRNDF
jgi:hypothetical protein